MSGTTSELPALGSSAGSQSCGCEGAAFGNAYILFLRLMEGSSKAHGQTATKVILAAFFARCQDAAAKREGGGYGRGASLCGGRASQFDAFFENPLVDFQQGRILLAENFAHQAFQTFVVFQP